MQVATLFVFTVVLLLLCYSLPFSTMWLVQYKHKLAELAKHIDLLVIHMTHQASDMMEQVGFWTLGW